MIDKSDIPKLNMEEFDKLSKAMYSIYNPNRHAMIYGEGREPVVKPSCFARLLVWYERLPIPHIRSAYCRGYKGIL